MITLLPNTTPADTNGAFAILNLLSDKTGYKKALQDLVDQAKVAKDALLNAQAAQKASEDIRAEAEAKHTEASDKLTQAETKAAELATLEAALNLRQRKLEADHAEHLDRLNRQWKEQFEEREKAVRAKEAEVDSQVKMLSANRVEFDKWRSEEEKKATQREREHIKRLATLDMQIGEGEEKNKQVDALKAELEARHAQLREIVNPAAKIVK